MRGEPTPPHQPFQSLPAHWPIRGNPEFHTYVRAGRAHCITRKAFHTRLCRLPPVIHGFPTPSPPDLRPKLTIPKVPHSCAWRLSIRRRMSKQDPLVHGVTTGRAGQLTVQLPNRSSRTTRLRARISNCSCRETEGQQLKHLVACCCRPGETQSLLPQVDEPCKQGVVSSHFTVCTTGTAMLPSTALEDFRPYPARWVHSVASQPLGCVAGVSLPLGVTDDAERL